MMKKAIAAVIAALMMLPSAGLTSAAEEAALSFGDPNGDGNIDAKDASFILAAYSRLSTGEEGVLTAAQSTAADVRTDGNVDAKDASAILAYYAYLSTGGELDINSFISDKEQPNVITTVASSTVTTQTSVSIATSEQVTVTTVPQIPDTGMSSKYDLTNDDPLEASIALDNLREELAKELFNGYVGFKTFSGCKEASSIIIALNANKSINREMVGEFFLYDTKEQFFDEMDILDICYYQYRYSSCVDFSKYVLDQDFADLINYISEKYTENMSGNSGTIYSEIDNYFLNNSVNTDNCIEYYFMCKTKESLGIDTPELEYAKQLYFDEVLTPLWNEVEPIRHFIYIPR